MAPCSPALKTEPESSVPLPSDKKTKAKAKRPNYRRRVKPPSSFAELITNAIKESPVVMLTLREILEHMAKTYECFRGSYTGWKNSVRHNLSINECFTKVLKDKAKPNGKDNYWAINPDCSHCKAAKAGLPRPSSTELRPTPESSPELHDQTTTPTPPQSGATSPSGTEASPASQGSSSPHADSPTMALQPVATPCSYPPDSTRDFPRDEWADLQDLYIPDDDIDISLYNDNWASSTTTPYNAQGQFPCRNSYPPQAGFHQNPPTRSPYTTVPHNGAFLPHTPVTLPPKMRFKSEYRSSTTRYHPYANHYNRHEHFDYSVTWSERVYPAERRYTECYQQVPNVLRTDPGIASAIRSSMGLDLDELALHAIDRSVRALDMTRPCDLMSS